MMAPEWLLVMPLLVTLGAAFAALVADAASSPVAGSRTAVAGLVLATGMFAYTAFQPALYVAGAVGLGGTYAVLGGAITGLAAVSLAAGQRRLCGEAHCGQIGALVAFSAAACVVLLGAADVAVLVIALELVALAGYALVAAARTPRAYEAAMKYFVQGAVATGLLLYGVAVLFGVSGGALSFDAIGSALAAVPGSSGALMALVLMLSALAFKLGAFPFHSWAPDAYETAPASVAAFLASAPKLAALVVAVRLLAGPFAALHDEWVLLAAALAVASVVFGNLAALRQTSFRRMLGYSGIAQVGYALTAIAGGGQTMQFAILVFGLGYALAAAGAFLAAEATSDGRDGSIAGLAGLGRRRPLLGAALAVCLLSLTGIPLTFGFWGKFFAFGWTATAMLWLPVVGVLGSVVSFGYYGGVLRVMYLDEAEAPEPAPEEEPVAEEELAGLAPRSVGAMAAEGGEGPAWPVVIVALLVLVGGIVPLVVGLPAFYAFLRLFG